MKYKVCLSCNKNLTINSYREGSDNCLYCVVRKEEESKQNMDTSSQQ